MRPDTKRPSRRFSIIVTAGPTREKIDPIRFISNYSTGKFGYEIAREARRRGNRVTLISGPTALEAASGVKLINCESANDMKIALRREFEGADILIMAGAVSDWRVQSPAKRKIKRVGDKKTLRLKKNPDIIAGLGAKKNGRVLVGFALETENLEENALRKLRAKNLDIIVANKLGKKGAAFGDSATSIVIIDRLGNKSNFYGKSKRRLAKIILDKILTFIYS